MSYLVQRGKFNNLNGTHMFQGRGLSLSDVIVNLEYMGYAEFEFGALGNSGHRMSQNRADYILKQLEDITTIGGVPVWVYCKANDYSSICEEIQRTCDRKTDYTSHKAATRFCSHFDFIDPAEVNRHKDSEIKKAIYASRMQTLKYERHTNFWWDINDDYMFFIGAEDRVSAFKIGIKEYLDNFEY